MAPRKVLKIDAVPTVSYVNSESKMLSNGEESIKLDNKKSVYKLLANYEEQQNIEDNLESHCLPIKRKMTTNTIYNVEVLSNNRTSSNKIPKIQALAVEGGIMLYSPEYACNQSSKCVENNVTDDTLEIITVTKEEADEELCKQNNTKVINVSSFEETKDIQTQQDQSKNKKSSSTSVYSPQLKLSKHKRSQVIFPLKGCEQRTFNINTILRERPNMLKGQNNYNEINTLKKLSGVLSLLLMQCIEGKYHKTRRVSVDKVKNSIERINCGWSMKDTSETLFKALTNNAYDELVDKFSIIDEV